MELEKNHKQKIIYETKCQLTKKKGIFESKIKFASTLVCGMKLKNSICIFNCIIMLHIFPRDEASWKQWVKIIGRDGWVPSKHSVLCSDHFTEDSFAVYSNRTKTSNHKGTIRLKIIAQVKKNIFFKVTKTSNKTTRKVIYDIESHFLLFSVHSSDSF